MPELKTFQLENLRSGIEPMNICVPECFHTQYAAGRTEENDENADVQPPESVLVLEDMRPLGYRVIHV